MPGLTLLTPAALPIVTTAEAKLHMRVDISDDDALIDSFVEAATDYVEQGMSRAFISQTWRLTLDGFPPKSGERCYWEGMPRDAIILPKSPVSAITTFSYVDTDGATQTLSDGTDYKLDTNQQPGIVVPAYDTVWPSAREEVASVTIDFVAGFGAATTDVRYKYKQAVLLLADHWYENREQSSVGNLKDIPKGVDQLIALNKVKTYGIFD